MEPMSVRSSDEGEPIAVIGLGCRFPGALGPAAFWSLLERRAEAVGPLPAERQGAGAGARVRGGFLADVDRFDARFFGISPREAERLDPQQRLLLEVAWEALEDAGLPCPSALGGSATGVFVGMWLNDYEPRLFARDRSRSTPHDAPAAAATPPAGRISLRARAAGAERDRRHRVLLVARGGAPGLPEPARAARASSRSPAAST